MNGHAVTCGSGDREPSLARLLSQSVAAIEQLQTMATEVSKVDPAVAAVVDSMAVTAAGEIVDLIRRWPA